MIQAGAAFHEYMEWQLLAMIIKMQDIIIKTVAGKLAYAV